VKYAYKIQCFSKSFLLPKIMFEYFHRCILSLMDIHLMFDNFDLEDTLNDFFSVQCVFDELGQVAARIHLMN
jgi:hypothetical protein